MNLFIIEKYIKKLKKENIQDYAQSQGITLTPSEIDTIYTYIKTYYKPFLTNKNIQPKLLEELKSKLTSKTASKLDELYHTYKSSF